MLTRRLSPPLRPGGSSARVSALSPVPTRTVHRPDVHTLRSVDRHNFAPVADTAGACPPIETLLALSVGGPLAWAFLNVRQTPPTWPARSALRRHLPTSGFNVAYNLCRVV